MSDDELLEALEDELEADSGFMSSYREQRLAEYKRELERTAEARDADVHGKLSEMKVEKDVIQATLKNKRTIIHFYHPDFRRCRLMDKHLESLAARHLGTRFIKVHVANVPFLVFKLEIKVLPCVITFVDGVTRDKIVGFEGVGDGQSDDFTTGQLELRLSQSESIAAKPGQQDGAIRRPF